MRRARLPLLRLLRIILGLRARQLDLAPGPLLIIAPHPDDEVLGCGGLMARSLRSGQDVSVLFLTDGGASHPGHPDLDAATLAHQRRREAREAAAVLGLSADKLVFFDFPDGALPHLSAAIRADAVQRIAAHLRSVRPATIFAAYRHDGSSEHEAAFRLVAAAIKTAGTSVRLLEYLVWTAYSPRLLARMISARGLLLRSCHPGLGPTKARALSAYRSQFLPTPPWNDAVQPSDFANAFSPETEFFIELAVP